MTGGYGLWAAGGLLRLLMRGIPRRRRFAAARWAASLAAPLLFNRVVPTGIRKQSALDSDRDYVLSLILALLKRSRVELTPPVALAGLQHLSAAVAAGRGVLLAGPHTLLTMLAVRQIHALGYDIVAVTRNRFGIPAGERSAIPHIVVSPMFLIAVREALLQGRIVYAMIDHRDPVPGKTETLDVDGCPVHVSDALLRLAARCNALPLFIASRTEGEVVSSVIVPPPRTEIGSGEVGLPEYECFMREYLGNRRPPR